jgi:excisionase family DNA binding protein
MFEFDTTTEETPRLLLSPRETARALGISERTLAQRTAEGVFPVVKIGRLTRYDVEVLRQWIRDHSQRKLVASDNENLTTCQ